jgi:uncharacterized protein YciI
MRFVVIFDDTAEMVAVRQMLEPEHLRYLEKHHAEIPMAGGLRNEHGGSYVGGLWVFEVADRARAVALIEADPYFIAYPRTYRLLAWGKALPHLQVQM